MPPLARPLLTGVRFHYDGGVHRTPPLSLIPPGLRLRRARCIGVHRWLFLLFPWRGLEEGPADRLHAAAVDAQVAAAGARGRAEVDHPGLRVDQELPAAALGGQGPFDYITMGGLFTILKVREGITSYEDPGWYKHPGGTVATLATNDQLSRDGIDVNAPSRKDRAMEHQHSG